MVLPTLGSAQPAGAGYASIVIDAETGQVLHEVNADTLNYPASLTKMMTLYLLFDAIKDGRLGAGDTIYASRHAAAQPPTKLGLRPGDGIRVMDAALALITKSANDAAVVIAEAIAGTEWRFGRMMTAKAAELGMRHTVFRNASGLPDPNQVSTARDLARLSQALIHDHPEYYGLFSTASFTYAGRTFETHNRFMAAYDGADGIKTGYIRASGYNLAASAVRDGRRLIAVVMGGKTARSRDLHMASLMDRAFATGRPEVLVAAAPRSRQPLRELAEAKTRPAGEGGRAPRLQPAAYTSGPAPRAAGTARAAATKGSWIIQVGVFSNKSSAKRVAREAADLIPNLPPHAEVGIMPLRRDGKQLYRARLTGVSREFAIEACRKLEMHQRDCLAYDSNA